MKELVEDYRATGVIHMWNDEAYRTKIDVVETLRKAAQAIAAGAL
jgi:hypothetical protein